MGEYPVGRPGPRFGARSTCEPGTLGGLGVLGVLGSFGVLGVLGLAGSGASLNNFCLHL